MMAMMALLRPAFWGRSPPAILGSADQTQLWTRYGTQTSPWRLGDWAISSGGQRQTLSLEAATAADSRRWSGRQEPPPS